MKITIGALVLCKVLISEPTNSNLSTQVNTTGSATNIEVSKEQEIPKTPVARQNEAAINNISRQPVIKEGNVSYTMLEGEVVKIYKREYYSPVGKTGKFEKIQEEDLVVKSKEIEQLVISSRACGLLSEYLFDEAEYKKNQSKIKEQKKQQNGKPAKEEIVVIRGDKIPEGFEKVELEPEIQTAVEKEYAETLKQEELKKNEEFLKNLENDQARFVKEQQSQNNENIAPQANNSSSDTKEPEIEKKEVVEPIAAVEPEKPQKSSKELFDEWEEERRVKLEEERRRLDAEKKKSIAIETNKKNEINTVTQKKVKVDQKSNSNDENNKSLLKDAFKIITNE